MKNFIQRKLLLCAVLSSCHSSSLKKEMDSIVPATPTKHEVEPTIDRITENRFAYIKTLDSTNANYFVQVDFVDYLTDEEAFDAAWRDKAYYVEGADTLINITDDYYISNVNPKLRMLKMSKNTQVKYILGGNGPQLPEQPIRLDARLIQTYVETKTLLFLYIQNGTIVRVDEQFLP